jgi:hypothetical protein
MNHINPDGKDLDGVARQPSLVHLYPGYCEHVEAYVVGNREGLLALRAAIDAALASDEAQKIVATENDVFCGDGEGYTLFVVRTDEDWRVEGGAWDSLRFPYTDERFARQPTRKWPYHLFTAADADKDEFFPNRLREGDSP